MVAAVHAVAGWTSQLHRLHGGSSGDLVVHRLCRPLLVKPRRLPGAITELRCQALSHELRDLADGNDVIPAREHGDVARVVQQRRRRVVGAVGAVGAAAVARSRRRRRRRRSRWRRQRRVEAWWQLVVAWPSCTPRLKPWLSRIRHRNGALETPSGSCHLRVLVDGTRFADVSTTNGTNNGSALGVLAAREAHAEFRRVGLCRTRHQRGSIPHLARLAVPAHVKVLGVVHHQRVLQIGCVCVRVKVAAAVGLSCSTGRSESGTRRAARHRAHPALHRDRAVVRVTQQRGVCAGAATCNLRCVVVVPKRTAFAARVAVAFRPRRVEVILDVALVRSGVPFDGRTPEQRPADSTQRPLASRTGAAQVVARRVVGEAGVLTRRTRRLCKAPGPLDVFAVDKRSGVKPRSVDEARQLEGSAAALLQVSVFEQVAPTRGRVPCDGAAGRCKRVDVLVDATPVVEALEATEVESLHSAQLLDEECR